MIDLAADKRITNAEINQLAQLHGLPYRVVMAIINVETGGMGFAPNNGKIIIQFEPTWFKRLDTDWRNDTKNTVWQSNQVGNQKEEWLAFNSAFASDQAAAMKSTSIGLPQLMGFHYAECNFSKVGQFWDYMKVSEYNQVDCMIRWMKSVKPLYMAAKDAVWAKVAYYYNGEGYRKFKYDTRLAAAYSRIQEYHA